MMHLRHSLGLLLCVAGGSQLRAADPDFARDVRPILSQYCFKCHGPDEKTRKGKLRLDDRESAITRGAIVAGKPTESELIARIESTDAEQVMPPPATKMTLTAQQKATLKAWVAQGAPYRQHWAFVKPELPAIPVTPANSGTVRNPIDAFVLARLQAAKLKPSPEADRVTLIRRVSLDLIGLPPTPAEVDAFVNDKSPDAYEKLVDRLLASPQYGERWARRWLDLARYADTNGYEKDRVRSIWPYRDWVIQALNADMPFDQFTVEQLAGDLLPNATPSQRIATGFHRNTMLNEEGGIDPLEFRFNAMTDRMATTGTTWLGLTLQCAQCHTHKYDPIAQKEYYGLFAYLNNADEPEIDVKSAEQLRKRQAAEAKVTAAIAGLAKKFPAGTDAEKAFADWLDQERKSAIRWQTLKPTEAKSNLPLLTVESDDSIFVSGDMTKRDVYDLTFKGDWKDVTAIRIEALPDDRLPKYGPGRVYYEGPHGDFHLSTITATVDGKPTKFASAGQTIGSAAAAIDDNPQTGWSINGGQGRRHLAVFRFAQPVSAKTLNLQMVFEKYYAAGLGRFRISISTAAKTDARDIPADIETLLLKPAKDLTPADRERLHAHFLLVTPLLAEPRKEIDTLKKQVPGFPTTLVFQERPASNPRPTYVHHRGEYLQPTDKVNPGIPAFLPGLPAGSPSDRLGFARWLVMPDNPLTARVIVNRHWAAFFGTGLVRTTEDFGYQGELPSHPELLDWLALEFMKPTLTDKWSQPWGMKHLHRVIVTSATYRQSSRYSEASQADPGNRLLSRGPRVRLEAEQIRDSILRASGLLSTKMGGPSIYPPQPASVTTEGTYGALAWKASEGEDRYRRGLYTFAKRTAPFAMTATFDGPSGEACVARRDTSNTPLQALTLLNDIVVTEAAQAVGKQIAAQKGSDREKIITVVRHFLVRQPTPGELDRYEGFVQTQRTRWKEAPAKAKALAGDGPGDPVERAVWTALARVVINLDEFVVKD